jgi:hypothetical protein
MWNSARPPPFIAITCGFPLNAPRAVSTYIAKWTLGSGGLGVHDVAVREKLWTPQLFQNSAAYM